MQAVSKAHVFVQKKSACGRILDPGVDILAKVLSFQESPMKPVSKKHISEYWDRLLAQNVGTRLAGMVI